MAEAQSGPDIVRLVAEHHRTVYQYAYRLSGSVQDAETSRSRSF